MLAFPRRGERDPWGLRRGIPGTRYILRDTTHHQSESISIIAAHPPASSARSSPKSHAAFPPSPALVPSHLALFRPGLHVIFRIKQQTVAYGLSWLHPSCAFPCRVEDRHGQACAAAAEQEPPGEGLAPRAPLVNASGSRQVVQNVPLLPLPLALPWRDTKRGRGGGRERWKKRKRTG